jgi:hypothetical protein
MHWEIATMIKEENGSSTGSTDALGLSVGALVVELLREHFLLQLPGSEISSAPD